MEVAQFRGGDEGAGMALCFGSGNGSVGVAQGRGSRGGGRHGSRCGSSLEGRKGDQPEPVSGLASSSASALRALPALPASCLMTTVLQAGAPARRPKEEGQPSHPVLSALQENTKRTLISSHVTGCPLSFHSDACPPPGPPHEAAPVQTCLRHRCTFPQVPTPLALL